MMIMRRGKKGTNEQLSDGDQKKSTGGQKRQKKNVSHRRPHRHPGQAGGQTDR